MGLCGKNTQWPKLFQMLDAIIKETVINPFHVCQYFQMEKEERSVPIVDPLFHSVSTQKGAAFYVQKVYSSKAGKLNFHVSYIYVKDKTGKKGWLKVPGHEFYHGEDGGAYEFG